MERIRVSEINSNTDDNKRLQIGLNFRKILETYNNNNSEENPNSLFSTGYVAQDIPDTKLGKFFASIRLFLYKISIILRKLFVVDFVFEVIEYLYVRLRIFFILGSVALELVGVQFEFIKKLIIKRMFWGRSSLFNVSIQFLIVFIVSLIFISDTYRKTVIAEDFHVDTNVASSVNEVYQSDVFVQNSSTITQINKDAGRIDPSEYIVKGGDSLSTIADEYQLQVQTILWANNLNEGDIIKPGMKLLIPQGDGVIVKVKNGDTVESLAKKYATSGQLIVEVNALETPYTLTPGKEIFLPDGVMPFVPKPIVTTPLYSGVIKSPSTGNPVTPNTGGARWLIWPVSGGGAKSQCYTGWHNGVDIADKTSPNIVAAAPGRVTFSGCQSGSCPAPGVATGGYGLAWAVVIDHGNGYSTVYGHLFSLYVKSGQTVTAGQAIGQMGKTGTAYGIHVHFMVVYSGTWKAVNPAQFMTTHICGY